MGADFLPPPCTIPREPAPHALSTDVPLGPPSLCRGASPMAGQVRGLISHSRWSPTGMPPPPSLCHITWCRVPEQCGLLSACSTCDGMTWTGLETCGPGPEHPIRGEFLQQLLQRPPPTQLIALTACTVCEVRCAVCGPSR